MEHLFVYGTLRLGESHAYLLERIGGSWRKASVRGQFYPQGIGLTLGYPVLVLDPQGDGIEGYLFSAEDLAAHWTALDDYEGEGYRRVCTEIRLDDGSIVQAHIYVLDEDCQL